jgi:hypothetical protein
LMSTAEKIEALYIATLSRKPSSEELKTMLHHVENGSGKVKQPVSEAFLETIGKVYIHPKSDPAKMRMTARLGDVMWVLLNSAEFRLNH